MLDRVDETYPEPATDLHGSISDNMVQEHLRDVPKRAKVLDVGCGQGVVLHLFRKRGFDAVGIGVDERDLTVCRKKGFNVLRMDQSELDFPPDSFDVVWCRHCLEHSVIPFYTLCGFAEVLKEGGLLYVEVPAPDTACRHEENKNHYSVLGVSMWKELIKRSGFVLKDSFNIDIGRLEDTYFAFVARKK